MWFWWFWGISFIVCYVLCKIMGMALSSKIKRELGDINVTKKTISEKISSNLILIVPFINIIIVFVMILTQDKLYNEIIKKYKNKEIK